MEDHEIAGVEPINVRDVWRDEALDFTPWLAENLHVLGEALDMDLELIQPEAPVGSFSLDILARKAGEDVKVAIENQLEWTDFGHLGQLLTYASGYDAHISIWVAPEFRYEHAEALHRLNDWTRDGIDFYGVQVTANRELRAVVSPGCWNKALTRPPGETMSPEARKHQDFFEPLIGELSRSRFPVDPIQRFNHADRLFRFPLHRRSGYQASFWNDAAWVSLHIELETRESTKRLFDELKKDQEKSERRIEGQDWHWLRHDGYAFSSINLRKDGCSIDDQPDKLAETPRVDGGVSPKAQGPHGILVCSALWQRWSPRGTSRPSEASLPSAQTVGQRGRGGEAGLEAWVTARRHSP